MKIIKTISKLFLFLLMFTSCTSDGTTGTEDLSLSGELVGFVYLYNVTGARLADNSGVIVTAIRSNYPDTTAFASDKYVDTTTVDGRFQLPKLSTGTYTITFSKSGYGQRKYFGYQFVGGGQAFYGSTSISAIPAFNVTSLTSSVTASTSTITFNGTLSGVLPASYRYIRLFIGTSSGVSSLPKNYILAVSGSASSTSTTFSCSLSSSNLASYGISTGQQLYAIAYADSYSSTSYIDLLTGRYIYSSINPVPSNVISAIAP